MKLVILSGLGETKKREALFQLKQRFTTDLVTTVDLKENSIAQLKNIIFSTPLFFKEARLVVVENCPDKFDLEAVFQKENQIALILVMANPHQEVIKKAQTLQAQIMSFPEEKETSVFPYLDYLIERKEASFLELNKLLQNYNWMYILTMIYYLLRRNLLPLPASEFARKKIIAQQKFLKEESLEKLYLLTLQTEYKIKNGLMEGNTALYFLTEKIIKE